MSRPLLLLDVDGPLNPFAAKATRRPEGFITRRLAPGGVTYRVWLNPLHGGQLLRFAEKHDVELVWATTWEHEANRLIGPVIGLPELPVIEWGFKAIMWKFNGVLEYAEGRPLAWLDDDFGLFKTEREWFEKERGDIPTLLHHVSPRTGFTAEDLQAVAAWREAL